MEKIKTMNVGKYETDCPEKPHLQNFCNGENDLPAYIEQTPLSENVLVLIGAGD